MNEVNSHLAGKSEEELMGKYQNPFPEMKTILWVIYKKQISSFHNPL
jgi:hypothetical protein